MQAFMASARVDQYSEGDMMNQVWKNIRSTVLDGDGSRKSPAQDRPVLFSFCELVSCGCARVDQCDTDWLTACFAGSGSGAGIQGGWFQLVVVVILAEGLEGAQHDGTARHGQHVQR
eukprot:3781521-Rhodomonas_salina.1